MRCTAASVLAFASAVLAQTANFDVITKPTEGSVVPAGKTFTITWEPTTEYNNDTITLTLLGGATPKGLQTISVIKAGVANSAGEFAWAVSKSLGAEANYGIEITLDSDPSILEYSFPFKISGGAASSSGSASASGSSTDTTTGTSAPTGTTKTTSSSSSASSSSSSSVKTTATTSSSSSTAQTTLTTKTSAAGNGTITTSKPSGSKTVITATETATKSGSDSTGTASTVATNDAKSLGAGSFVTLIGGLAVAIFAL
ncbi:GPI anchored serine-threonineeeee rich protein [Sporothrix brasiliensis 5110]|uniref:GPI anchored serine-threonineeeee rich protein n=1 Tax=Sporothrix brasiliensis 5110 TaxID=1398154 RepID=A0A0C2IJ30_9PEZI|nr:GPI anchored serine-threonineeeee rich protein [Sporothrix brasiliensis 5110]KIH86990.1 GPI anchored serine-threonineeeee rich protein [Sporothrix brasiliensis 5110]